MDQSRIRTEQTPPITEFLFGAAVSATIRHMHGLGSEQDLKILLMVCAHAAASLSVTSRDTNASDKSTRQYFNRLSLFPQENLRMTDTRTNNRKHLTTTGTHWRLVDSFSDFISWLVQEYKYS
jgi:hypothetical protein